MFRQELNRDMAQRSLPIHFVGLGSLITIHFSRKEIRSPRDIPAVSKKLGQLFHMENILRSILVAARGDIFFSLAVTSPQREQLRQAIDAFADAYQPLVERELDTKH